MDAAKASVEEYRNLINNSAISKNGKPTLTPCVFHFAPQTLPTTAI
jgi:hypothetical protein